jgi:hypothetical protein
MAELSRAYRTHTEFFSCALGNKLAMEYLEFIRRRPFPLGWIVADMPFGSDKSGIEVGFLGSVTRAVGAWYAGRRLSEVVRHKGCMA